ncbi:Serine/threonine-protein kinase RAD53 [Podospora fimiseda]|uniref:Autophagy-related protein 1 n=1 Tax=Podospora fimiseda TaxID=252190 RepID=A0AAN7BP29_9PEZI|nr:Serine/threonine-protein kinase RAD53 [Podospora fimiseda]
MDTSSGDSQEFTQPATQQVVDGRRVGQQVSGFSDEEISDIICVLVPYSDSAIKEVNRLASENSQYVVGRDDVDKINPDLLDGGNERTFTLPRRNTGDYHLALKFSHEVKNTLNGFTFGRNLNRCDICFLDDPMRRLSNIHFRIYLNEHNVLMLEDESTNGTLVDNWLLKRKGPPPNEVKRTLENGNKVTVLMHVPKKDLTFMVRIPHKEGQYSKAYRQNFEAYMANRAACAVDVNATIVPGPGGHVDIFKPAANRLLAAQVGAQGRGIGGPAKNGSPTRQQFRTSAVGGLNWGWPGSSNYARVGEIGKGAFATVYKVTSRFTGEPYAAKELDKRRFMKNGVLDQKVENEMKIMQAINHKNCVQYIEHIDFDDRLLIIIMEYVGKGDLGKMIAENGPLTEMAVKIMANQLLDALGYLHDKNITHRDVKPDNILVSSHEPFVVKLTDFGLSKMIDKEEDTFLRTFCGTLLYCAPEVYSEFAEYDHRGRRHPRNRRLKPTTGQRYDHAVDIWSLGGVLFYALTKQPPFPTKPGTTHSQLLHQIMTTPLDISPLQDAKISEEGIDFLRLMLDRRPETRATVAALKKHPWIAKLDQSEHGQSFEEIEEEEEEELRVNASQLSIQDIREEMIHASDDEISNDYEEVNHDDQMGEGDSQKENYTFGPGVQPPPRRLFGEVNASAVEKNGGVTARRLNLPISADIYDSDGETEILGHGKEIKDSFDSDRSLTPRQKSQKSQPIAAAILSSPTPSQGDDESVEDLNTKTFDVLSQSLGGAESIFGNLDMKSRAGPSGLSRQRSDFTSSKRKQSSSSEEDLDAPAAEGGRGLKRFRSETSVHLVANRAIERGDFELMAQIPPINKNVSGLQIDNPVNKSTYWSAQDRSTWHLDYPEMTQLQFDAFHAAAKARNEQFAPEKTALWPIAVKYFPSTSKVARPSGDKEDVIPSTAPRDSNTSSFESMPDTQSQGEGDPYRTMRQMSERGRPVVASLMSAPGSAVPGIQVLITESMVSWGRAAENTRSYVPKTEALIPKYACKILLWRPNYDPYKLPRPWNRDPERDHRSTYFYISTKATNGIYINGVHLPSYDRSNPAGPSRNWMALYDTDRIAVWQTQDASRKAEIIFRCTWGGSAEQRPVVGRLSRPERVSDEIANELDLLAPRVERKMRSLTEHDLRLEEASHDVERRNLRINEERKQSRAFEVKRLQACRACGGKRVSPSPIINFGSTTYMNYDQHNMNGAMLPPGQQHRIVPTFRRPSPTASEMLRAARY